MENKESQIKSSDIDLFISHLTLINIVFTWNATLNEKYLSESMNN